MLNRIYHLIHKDFTLSFRNIQRVMMVLLYLVGASFISYKALVFVEPRIWNALFWILFLFISISATNLSFSNESGSKVYFLYNLYSPYEVLISKIIFNFILLILLAAGLILIMAVFFPFEVQQYGHLFYALALSSFGISVSFSFISSIASLDNSNMSLMSIMAIPTILPIFLTGLKITAYALGIIAESDIASDYLILGAIDLIILGIVLLLFPYLWKS